MGIKFRTYKYGLPILKIYLISFFVKTTNALSIYLRRKGGCGFICDVFDLSAILIDQPTEKWKIRLKN